MATLNLGILAHVDAGKTTLTERILYASGVIERPGSVDAGTTQTDSLALEQERGITIRSAVASFAIGDLSVNLIDTPGHPDFIAEVERVLGVLDGAVLVVSAVEGVQPQTRILMRALKRLQVPTIIFINKIDRVGADGERALHSLSLRLDLTLVPMGSPRAEGGRDAGFVPADEDSANRARLASALADGNDELLADFVDHEQELSNDRLRLELAAQTRRSLIYPVFFGSAITGAGVPDLMKGIAELLPATVGDTDHPLSGVVFKIDRGPAGEKVAYVRMFSGSLRTRDRADYGLGESEKVTALSIFGRAQEGQSAVGPGQIAKVWGLRGVRIGDWIGKPRSSATVREFPPPTMESVVAPTTLTDAARVAGALRQLAEQDPLINVRWDAGLHENSVSLYGEVQKEVIQATLLSDFGLAVEMRETTTIYVERPAATGEWLEILQSEDHPFSATVGLRIEPAPPQSGTEFRLEVSPRSVPLHLYTTVDNFRDHMRQYITDTFEEGLLGWRVTDCVVTMTACGYYASDGPRKPISPTPRTAESDFRNLTPIVLMRALALAGTLVCEPMMRARIEAPADSSGAVLGLAARLSGVVENTSGTGDLSVIDLLLPVTRVRDAQVVLPGITGGEGVMETSFAGYTEVSGTPPLRARTTANPLNREEYMMQLSLTKGRVSRRAPDAEKPT